MDFHYFRKVTRVLSEPVRRLGLSPEFVKFLMVGSVAFVVNQLALYLLYDAPLFSFLPGKDTRIDLGLVAHPDARLLIASSVAVEVAILLDLPSSAA